MQDIIIKNLNKSFGSKPVLKDLSLTIPAGKVTCLMGPSGSGKTTLLRILMGLDHADSGTVTNLPETVSAVFQEDRLCDTLTVRSNLKFALGYYDDNVKKCLTKLNLTIDEAAPFSDAFTTTGPTSSDTAAADSSAKASPADFASLPVSQLSGGMRRRVAIARALLADGELLLMDEPFKGLDEATRKQVMDTVLEYANGRTLLIVTHDKTEAEYLGSFCLTLPD